MRRLTTIAAAAVLFAAPLLAAPPTTKELLRYVPAGATAVIGTDLAALRQAPGAQKWLEEHQSQWSGVGDKDQFFHDAGLDPARDVDTTVMVVTAGEGDHGFLAAFGGRYDAASLAAALVKRGATKVEAAGTTLYKLPREHEGHHGEEVLVWPSNDTVLVGTLGDLEAALSGSAAGSALVDDAVAARHVDLRAPFWMVADVPARVREHAQRAEKHAGEAGAPAMQSVIKASAAIERVAGYATVDDVLTVHGFATANDAENAGLIRDTVKGALAAMRLHAQGTEPELVEVLRDVKVSVDGTEVEVDAAIPMKVLDDLAARAKAHKVHVHKDREGGQN